MNTDQTARRLGLIATCAVGLLVAAFAAPVTAPSAEFDSGGDSEAACAIYLSEEPVPGQPVTATIKYEDRAATSAPVWFNGEFVGRTDDEGRVTGAVPYERRLRIRVQLPSGGRCRAGSSMSGGVSEPAEQFRAAGLADTGGDGLGQQDSANGTGEYVVRGSIDIQFDREPYPGETATVTATIRGNPVPDATVTVDGREVGQTDSQGRYTLTAPEAGDGTIDVRVERGEFESVKQLTVLRLDARIETTTLAALPGQDAVLDAGLGDRPARDATVTRGGDRVGTTDADGSYEFELPANPAATLTVSTADQRTTVPVWPMYVPIVVLVLAFAGVTAGIPMAGYLHSGRSGFVRSLLLVGNVYVLAISYVAGGGRGLLGAVALIVALAAVVAVVRYDYPIRESLVATGRSTRDLGERLVSGTLWLTGRLEAGVDGLGAVLESLRAWLTDVRSWSLADARRWLGAVPGRLAAFFLMLLGAPTRLGDRLGDDDEAGIEPGDDSVARADRTRSARERFRALWRQFASQVLATGWHNRTAGEVRRQAIEQGLPDEPVTELTEVFRAVEYGTEPLSEEQVERAREALASITADDAGGEES